jgi:glycosyltransferase involved in cell wall biosynthesis
MRIAFVIENQLGHRALLSNLRAAVERDHSVASVWCPLDPTGDSLLERTPHLRDKHALIFGLKARKLLREAEIEGKVDAYYLHTQRMAHLMVDRMRKVPTFLSIDATPAQLDHYLELEGADSQRGSVYWKLRDAIHRRTYGAAQGIITTSSEVASTLVRVYGVNAQDVLVLWPSVDTDTWSPPANHSEDGPRRVLFVGADFERKGGDLLLRWVCETKRRDIQLDIVTKQQIEPRPGVTVHTGFVPNDPGLVELARQADLFVLPSRADVSPWAISEAKAAGTAVVSTRVGVISELVREDVDGWLVPANDYAALSERLESALADRERLTQFGVRAREDAVARLDQLSNARRLLEFMRVRL